MKRLFIAILNICFLTQTSWAVITPPASQEALTRAFENFLQGKELYYELSFDQSLSKLKKAQTLYYQNLPSITKGEELFDSHLYAALCYSSQKQKDLAKEEIRKAYLLNPKRTLDPKVFSPEFIQFFIQASGSFKNNPKGKLEVHSTPSFAKVWVNGFEMGLTPIIIRDWPQGEHAVRIILEDHKEWIATITVIENKTQKISAQLVPYTGPEQWLTRKTSQNRPLQTPTALSLETQKFLEAMNKPQEESFIWTSSLWFWSLAALAAGGAAYVALQSQNKKEQHPQASSSAITVNLP
ncbi:MAG: PEGA domain-containing protein [Deltaproteobacteria bacterium]|nr:PEGA domain-containing protein [Deltaproteobacteria bacterium]